MNRLYLLLLLLIVAISCRGDESDLQKIDQVINVYITNSDGQDLLNSDLDGSYISYELWDLNGTYDLTEITSGFSLETDDDDVNFIEYISGATRVLTDSVSPNLKYYQSEFSFNLEREIDEDNTTFDIDTMTVNYLWTNSTFEVSTIYWDEELVFTKTEGEPNTVKIIK